MKEQDLHIGCSYLATAGAIEKIITPTGRATLSAAFDYFSTGHLKGIPLDEDALVRLGAIKIGLNFAFKKFTIWHSFYDKSFQVRYSFIGDDFERKINLKTVHQFQLLYFSLTGEFLPYKQ